MLSRRHPPKRHDGAAFAEPSSRFVLKVNRTCPRGRLRLHCRRCCARLTALRQRLLARLCLDRERDPAPQRIKRQPYIGEARASSA